MLVFHINDNTEISVRCIGSVVGRLKDIIKYHTVVKVISAEFVNKDASILACLLACSNIERASLQQVVLQAPSSATAAMLYTIRFRAYL